MTQKEERLLKENQRLQEEIAYLKEQLDQLKRLLLGKKKETWNHKVSDGQLSLFDEPHPLPEGVIEEVTQRDVQGYQRAKKRYRLKDTLHQYPVEEVHHYLEGPACQCPHCQGRMKEMGQAGYSDEVIFIPQQIKVKRHIQHTYVCSNYAAHAQDVFKKSPLPQKPIQQSLASASMISEVISQKFEYFLPCHRQEKRWQRLGLPLTRRTLSQWIIHASERYLAPLCEVLQDHLVKEEVLHADETPVRVLASQRTNSYCWLTRTAEGARHPVVLYHWEESRSRSVLDQLLGHFTGYLHCDGYSAYSHLKGITPVHCLAHIRRKFYDSQSNPSSQGVADQAVRLCDQMFKVERELQKRNVREASEVVDYRQKHLAPLFEQFQEWINLQCALARSALGQAITYARKFFPSLQAVLKDARLTLSNNLAERSLRQVALGRKNWLFSQSFEGAKANGVCLSIIQTANENGLNAWKYLNYLFSELPNLMRLNQESLEAYLPWTAKVQAVCS